MNARFTALLIALSAAPAFAQQTPQQIADAELPSLITIYKDLHTHPELSTHEERSAAIVAKELKAAGCEVTEKVGKYEKPELTCFGVIGVMKNGDGPTVAIRTDLDALPVREETGVPYASTVTTKNDAGQEVGVMHACGHDIHMSTFIGTARALGKLKDKWKGTIIFIGQPAEETVGGARALLKDGLYTRWPKPAFVLGLHDDAEIATGQIGVTEGYCYANVDSVDVTIRGVGGHGAYPHKTKDPIVLSAEIINAWQTIASRENNPIDPIVITVGSIHGGTKHNIIPDEVKMQLTVRTYKQEVRERVLAAIERIAKGIAATAGIPADRAPIVQVLRDQFTPATYNNPELTKRVAAALKTAIGNDNVIAKDPTMGGEDFS
ncbi:MAG: M20 family metallopeptidase, partial [Chthoniobacterales bacterium]